MTNFWQVFEPHIFCVKNTQVPKISTFYFVKINHKNLSSYITNNKTFSSYKKKNLDLEKTPFRLLLLNTWRPLWYHCQWKVSELQFSFKIISTLCVGVHTVKIIRYGTVPVFFIRFRYSNGTDTGYFLYFVDVFEILSCVLVLGKVWWGWPSTM